MKLQRRKVSPKTNKQYRKIVKALRKQAAFELHYELNEVSIDQICEYILKKHRDRAYKASTWRLYRAAMNHVYGLGIGGKESLAALDKVTGGGNQPKPIQYGASRKMKSFPEKMFSEVINHLSSARVKTKISPVLMVWMWVGLETGLRPHEWLHAEVVTIDNTPYLKVRNSKQGQERANGEYRHLELTHVDAIMRRYITSFLQIIRALHNTVNFEKQDKGLTQEEADELLERTYKNFYDSCRRRLRTVLMQLFPGRSIYPSLYSLRHQFIANCKKDGMSKPEIAALCGQASAETAALHYGRKAAGDEGRVMVKPHPEEVKTVRVSSREFTPGKLKEVDLENEEDR